ncbi:MAG: hypothetical protein MUF50_02680 [Planctomycetes bacterium]|jgi:hypothetical protein|nr:hypothetical protein [Planctomycetota bacterium]
MFEKFFNKFETKKVGKDNHRQEALALLSKLEGKMPVKQSSSQIDAFKHTEKLRRNELIMGLLKEAIAKNGQDIEKNKYFVDQLERASTNEVILKTDVERAEEDKINPLVPKGVVKRMVEDGIFTVEDICNKNRSGQDGLVEQNLVSSEDNSEYNSELVNFLQNEFNITDKELTESLEKISSAERKIAA